MLSTKHDLTQNKTGKKNRKNEDIVKTQIIIDYNKGKQGVDLSDQMSSYFSPLRKTIRWYHKIAFEYLLSTSVVNSLILYKQNFPKTKILDFKMSICRSLCGVQRTNNPNQVQNVVPAKLYKLHTHRNKDKRNRTSRKRCVKCNRCLRESGDSRAVAIRKTGRVTTYCDTCAGQPSLCLNCFNKLH